MRHILKCFASSSTIDQETVSLYFFLYFTDVSVKKLELIKNVEHYSRFRFVAYLLSKERKALFSFPLCVSHS